MARRRPGDARLFRYLACGGAGCPGEGGTWTFQTHSCYSEFVGKTITISQSGCSFTTSGYIPGYAGTIDSDGNLTMSSPTGSITCTGLFNNDKAMIDCSDGCHFTMSH